MIAKIGHGTSIMGALMYNFQKVLAGKGYVLGTQNICQAKDGSFSLPLSYRSFEPYLVANRNTEKPSLHISLNPDPKDSVDDNRFMRLAADYIREMGYGDQPYIVFKHNDIERPHIHIVSTNVDENGRKIPDTFEHKRSMDICRALENKYGLTSPIHNEEIVREALFKPVDYQRENIKGQIASVIRYLPQYYSYQSLGAYNALLSLFNITVQEVTGELNGKPRQGLLYFALDEKGQKASHPFKASLFGKTAGHEATFAKFEKSQEMLGKSNTKGILKSVVEAAVHSSINESDFCGQLKKQGINVVVRRNPQSRIYGITFIDHTSRSVWNGSQLDKKLSANVFEQWWNNRKKIDGPQATAETKAIKINSAGKPESGEVRPEGFRSEPANPEAQNVFEGIMDILLPTTQADDFEELLFGYRMKKRKRKNK